MSSSVIKTFAIEHLLASNLGISFFPSYGFEVTLKGKLLYSRHIQSPGDMSPKIEVMLPKRQSYVARNGVIQGKIKLQKVVCEILVTVNPLLSPPPPFSEEES